MFRAGNFLGAIAMLVGTVLAAVITLGVIWLLSDVAYDLGMWPIGAVLRIGWWLSAVGFAFGILGALIYVVISPFMSVE